MSTYIYIISMYVVTSTNDGYQPVTFNYHNWYEPSRRDREK
jgi:hypothetical protein